MSRLTITIIIIFSVFTKSKGQHFELATKNNLDTSINKLRVYSGIMETIRDTIAMGDLNGNGTKDKAYTMFKQIVLPDSTIDKGCGQNVCYVQIAFSDHISEVIIEGYSGYLKKAGDVNGDHRDDILIFTSNNRPIWGDIQVLSYKNNKWRIIAKVPAFLGDDAAYENRIVKAGKSYFVLADIWNKEGTGFYRKKVAIKSE